MCFKTLFQTSSTISYLSARLKSDTTASMARAKSKINNRPIPLPTLFRRCEMCVLFHFSAARYVQQLTSKTVREKKYTEDHEWVEVADDGLIGML